MSESLGAETPLSGGGGIAGGLRRVKKPRREFGLPLLAKELYEQAARRRTYVIRVAYACCLFGGAMLVFHQIVSLTKDRPLAALGQGRRMFDEIVLMQLFGMCIFLPAMTCGVITHEKERNSLGLLILTRLGPWTIVFEKMLSRLVPMWTFFLLSLPLMAFAYMLGGVTQSRFWTSLWLLFMTSIQAGALCVACSVFCRTTFGAFCASYVVGFMLFAFVPPCSGWLLVSQSYELSIPIVIGYTIITCSSILFFLWFAANSLVERAFLEPRESVLLMFFRALDSMFTEMNKITGGIVLVHDEYSLPGDEPLAWREMEKKSLGTVRYLFRVLVAIEFPVLVVMTFNDGRSNAFFLTLLYVVWGVSLPFIAVHATTLVAGERTRQTLEVLLTTPFTGSEIILSKFRSVKRLMSVLSIPFLSIFGFDIWFRAGGTAPWRWETPWELPIYAYTACSLMTLLVYPRLAAWIGVWIGLRYRPQLRAIMLSLAALVFLIFAPLALERVAHSLELIGPAVPIIAGPVTIIANIETEKLNFPATLVHFVAFGGLAWYLRRRCLTQADRLLGRCETVGEKGVGDVGQAHA